MAGLAKRDQRMNLWRAASPLDGPPDLVLMVAKRIYRVALIRQAPFALSGGILVIAERRTDIRPKTRLYTGDIVELPAASGQFYTVDSVEDSRRDTALEERIAVLLASDKALPIP